MQKGYKTSEQLDASMKKFKASEIKKLESMMKTHNLEIAKRKESYV